MNCGKRGERDAECFDWIEAILMRKLGIDAEVRSVTVWVCERVVSLVLVGKKNDVIEWSSVYMLPAQESFGTRRN